MTWPAPIRIVGIGSSHGDDALGWEVVRLLREQLGSRPDIETYWPAAASASRACSMDRHAVADRCC